MTGNHAIPFAAATRRPLTVVVVVVVVVAGVVAVAVAVASALLSCLSQRGVTSMINLSWVARRDRRPSLTVVLGSGMDRS
ncbi:hypothetical protein [Actinoplanes rectilineatus]|uniref:hypothetical protein n=1 Tax=Actinoplanes rectilineatus TaxID=113571 RepID=UPI0005F28B53|nr:hypothetical protein [Actinoplanes rectilineatus]